MRWVTWNLNGLDDALLDQRAEAAMFTVLLGGDPEQVLAGGRPPAPPPDGVLLQEVVARTFHAHVRPHLLAAGYTVVPESPPPREAFEVLAVRRPHRLVAWRVVPLPGSLYGRELLEGELAGGIRVMTGHLDSLAEGARARTGQLAWIVERLGDGPAWFGGDTNLRDREVPPLGRVVDAWEALGRPAHARVTWPGHHGMRFDRFYLSNAVPKGMRLVGTQPIPGLGVPPSDHLGVMLDVDPRGGVVA